MENKKIEDMEQREVIAYMNNVINDELKQIRKRIMDENKVTQFDYCTSPALASAIDSVEGLIKSISKLVYQEQGGMKV